MDKGVEMPECLSIIICDDIYRDVTTKKMVIVGTFNRICSAGFPANHQRMHVLFTLTSGNGTYDVAIRIEHAATGNTLIQVKGPMDFEDPNAIVDVNVTFGAVTFPEPGRYWVCIDVNGELIKQRPFNLVGIGKNP